MSNGIDASHLKLIQALHIAILQHRSAPIDIRRQIFTAYLRMGMGDIVPAQSVSTIDAVDRRWWLESIRSRASANEYDDQQRIRIMRMLCTSSIRTHG
jgi:hypothetical protein